MKLDAREVKARWPQNQQFVFWFLHELEMRGMISSEFVGTQRVWDKAR